MRLVDVAKVRLRQTDEEDFATLARIVMDAKGRFGEARLKAEAQGHQFAIPIFEKAQDAGTLGGDAIESPDSWGSHLGYPGLSAAFLARLAQSGVFDAAVSSMPPALPNTRVLVNDTAADAGVVAEGAAKPVGGLGLSDEIMPVLKVAGIVVVSAEVVKAGNPVADAVINTELQKSVVSKTDDKFLTDLIAATTPASSANDFLTDLATLLGAISGDGASRYFVVVDPANAKRLAVLRNTFGGRSFPELGVNGGNIGGVTVLVSDQLDAGDIVAFDAAQIPASAGAVALDASGEANVDMADGNTPNVSLWQKDLRGLRAERAFSYKIVRTSAVASIENATYVGESPA